VAAVRDSRGVPTEDGCRVRRAGRQAPRVSLDARTPVVASAGAAPCAVASPPAASPAPPDGEAAAGRSDLPRGAAASAVRNGPSVPEVVASTAAVVGPLQVRAPRPRQAPRRRLELA